MTRFLRSAGKRVAFVLDPPEVTVLRDIAGQLGALLTTTPSDPGADPVRDRLFPRAYLDPTEEQAEADWQSVVHSDLVRSRSEAVASLVAGLDGGRERRGGGLEVALTPEEAERWIGALNDARLALGVVLGITEDMEDLPADDPRSDDVALYHWLTWLQGTIVDVLLGDA